ncbi:hypothetical protein TWF694_009684 [Orbilia ellipsospora]|uniref:Uncharacterized protein n=1 Tax=Orbilia ellipsospora TaxID=2528407 RepID=A0AAV9XBX1_9PEZI
MRTEFAVSAHALQHASPRIFFSLLLKWYQARLQLKARKNSEYEQRPVFAQGVMTRRQARTPEVVSTAGLAQQLSEMLLGDDLASE